MRQRLKSPLTIDSSTQKLQSAQSYNIDSMPRKTVSQAATSAPVINLTFGNEFATLFKPPIAPAPNAPATDVGLVSNLASSLLPPSRKCGDNMSIAAFCMLYKLDDSIMTKFVTHSFKEAHLLRYVTISDLKEMEFKFGEIAALRDAVEKWSSIVQ
jgi:hypothetical protein